ncbi:MAG TPA: hypothetical protein VJB99_02300 [Patescibacteria group bacterium]|nr:hypothetical protein [Patescibacteria group bacterium]
MKFFVGTVVLISIFSFLYPSKILANSIGISPGTLSVQVLEGENSEQKFLLSRTETAEEYRFTVSVREGAEYLDLKGQQELVIPTGQRIAHFPFLIKATNLDFGDYEAVVEFTLESKATGESVAINHRLAGKVFFSVVGESFFLAQPIDVSLTPEVGNEVVVSPVFITRAVGRSKVLVANWSLKNTGDRSLHNVLFLFSITQNGLLIYSNRGLVSETIDAGQSVSVERLFESKKGLSPGIYKVLVSSGPSSQSAEIVLSGFFGSTVENRIFFTLFFLLFGMVLIKKTFFSWQKEGKGFFNVGTDYFKNGN